MNKIYIASVLMLLLIIGSSGCGIVSTKAHAQQVATNLFEAIRNKDFDTAMTFYAPEFFEETPVDWMQVLKNVNAKLGDLETYKLDTWSINKFMGTTGSGTYFKAQYEVTYSRYTATEKLTLFKPDTGSEFKIIKHDIESFGLFLE